MLRYVRRLTALSTEVGVGASFGQTVLFSVIWKFRIGNVIIYIQRWFLIHMRNNKNSCVRDFLISAIL